MQGRQKHFENKAKKMDSRGGVRQTENTNDNQLEKSAGDKRNQAKKTPDAIHRKEGRPKNENAHFGPLEGEGKQRSTTEKKRKNERIPKMLDGRWGPFFLLEKIRRPRLWAMVRQKRLPTRKKKNKKKENRVGCFSR